MTDNLRTTMIELWQAACQDRPARPSCRVADGRFVLTVKGNRPQWVEIVQAAGVPSHAAQQEDGDTLTASWESHADTLFGADGPIARQAGDAYEVRPQQLYMGRLVQRAIEMREPAVVEGATGTGKCLHGDTLITLADGTQKRIAELVGTAPLIAQVGNDLIAKVGKVRTCWGSGEKPLYHVTSRLGREIKSTLDHRFLTIDGWKRLKDLQLGDKVAVPRFMPAPLRPVSMPHNEIVFLAHMIADGTCTLTDRVGYTKADLALVEDWKIAVSRLPNAKPTVVADNKGGITYGVQRTATTRRGRNGALACLESHDLLGKNSQAKTIPAAIFRLPNNELALFLGRLFSGDGYVQVTRSLLEYSSASKTMVEQIQLLLLRFGVIARMRYKVGKIDGQEFDAWKLTIMGAANVYLFAISVGEHMIGDKKRALDKVLENLPAEGNPNVDLIPCGAWNLVDQERGEVSWKRIRQEVVIASNRGRSISRSKMLAISDLLESPDLRVLAESDVYWDEITAIAPAGEAMTYDIEMEDDPNFIADGFVVHNSFAYAAVCMAMGKRVVISTSNKALQMQLYKKDLPFLQKIFPGRRVALAVGKGNYACRHKAEDQVSGSYAITHPQLLEWYTQTENGNLEEIPFAVDWQELEPIKVDENCLGKMCGRFHECFYYRAKEERALADVIITNHALLCLHQLYPGAGILPDADVIVVDEAHKLPDYARNALGVELTLKGLEKAIHKATKHDVDTGPAFAALRSLEATLRAYQLRTREPQIALRKDETLPDGVLLAQAMYELSDEIWEADILPTNPADLLAAKDADYICSRASYVAVVSAETEEKFVRWIENGEKLKLVNTPWDVSEFVGRLAGFETKTVQRLDHTQCARCGRKLTAQTVNVLEGRPYGPDCIQHVDPFGDAEKVALAEWLDADREEATTEQEALAAPVIFTSATLAAPDMSAFMRECGLPHALQMQVESPFDYRENALLYVPNGATPDPKNSEYLNYLVDDLRRLVLASGGGAFLLFTSYANMRHCVEALRNDFERRGWAVYVQGELPKLEIAKRFAADGDAVLFATKSFFEGVSIDGAALRLVCIDKMPFEAPSPLNNAQEEALRTYAADVLRMPPNKAQWYPFEALRVPRMTIELKQGVGRLIRTASDWGVMAILDPRLRTSRYGRQMVLPSLPPAGLVHHTMHVERFFNERKEEEAEQRKVEERKRREAALPVDKVMVYEGDLLLWQ